MAALSKPEDINPESLVVEEQATQLITRQVVELMVQSQYREAVEVNHLNHMEVDINDLKEQLEQKDGELAVLEKKVKDLEDKNNCLCIKLEAKDKEVKSLKERMRTLEEEKKALQEQLASVQQKLKSVEDDVKKLTNFRESDQERYNGLEEMFKRIAFKLEGVVSDLETSKTENKKLNQELKQACHRARYVPGAQPLLPVQASEETKARRHLGEMCCQIQDAMYKKILPQYFTSIMNYKVKSFIKDIKKLSKTEDEKEQALKRWEDLKVAVQWNEGLEKALDALQNTYSRSLDPIPTKLSEEVLRGHTQFLGMEGVLRGWLSTELVNSLITIWKSLCVQSRSVAVLK